MEMGTHIAFCKTGMMKMEAKIRTVPRLRQMTAQLISFGDIDDWTTVSEDNSKSHKKGDIEREKTVRQAFELGEQNGNQSRGRDRGLRARVLRSPDVRKNVGTEIFAGRLFTILKPVTTENEEITPSKKKKLQANMKLNLRTPPATPQD